MARKNWKKIELEYIKGTDSYRELALKYKISLKQISDHGKKNDWVQKRKQFRSETYTEALVRARDKEIDNFKRIITLTEKMADHLEEALNDPSQFRRYLVSESKIGADGLESTTKEKTFKKVDAKSIKNLASALKDVAVITREMDAYTQDKNSGNEVVVRFESGKEKEADEWSS